MKNHLSVQLRGTAGIAPVGCITLSLAACGGADLERGSTATASPVSFDWTRGDAGDSGRMTATLRNGMVFSGRFIQAEPATRGDAAEPVWLGGQLGWGDWSSGVGRAGPGAPGATVVANLNGPVTGGMRCVIALADARAGLAGGGQAECRLDTGRVIEVMLPRA